MDAKELVQHCERLSPGGRIKHMIGLGRRAATDASVESLISDLSNGSRYEQLLGLYTCYGSRDAALAVQAITTQSSKILRLEALNILSMLATDEQVLGVAFSLPRNLLAYLIHRLWKRKRTSVTDSLISQLADCEDEVASVRKLLPFASTITVKRLLPKVIDYFSPINWMKLIKTYPTIAFGAISKWIEETETPDPLLLEIVDRLIEKLSMEDSTVDMAFELIEGMLKIESLPKLGFIPLIRLRPQRVVQMITDCKDRMPLEIGNDLLPAYKHVSTIQLLLLFERQPDIVSPNFLGCFSPERRAIVYQHFVQRWLGEDGTMGASVIGFLPTEHRLAEARRNIPIATSKLSLNLQIPYFSLLPWDEAMENLVDAFRSNDADLRSKALKSQIESIKYHRDRLGDSLSLVIRHGFEQDPVRNSMYHALGNLPPSCWKECHLPDATIIIRRALDSAETSYSSLSRLYYLVNCISMFHPAWGAAQLAVIIRERDFVASIKLPWPGNCSTKISMLHIVEALSPIIEGWRENDKVELLLDFADGLGPNIRYFPQLLDTLETVLDRTSDRDAADTIFEILVKYRYEKTLNMLPSFLESDLSRIMVVGVLNFVRRKQPQLLTPPVYLEEKVFEGHFATDDERLILPIQKEFQNWSLKQQDRFASTIVTVLKDHERPVTNSKELTKRLARLCFVEAKHLIQFLEDERPVVRENALRALGMLDTDEAVPILTKALKDERARIAIYSLRRTLVSRSQHEALKILQGVRMDKVTIAKEVIRLTGSLKIDDAYQYLLALDKEDLHKDVRTVLFQTMGSSLQRPQTWEMFTRAAHSNNEAELTALASLSFARIPAARQESLIKVFETILGHPLIPVRLAALNRLNDDPPRDLLPPLAPRIISLLSANNSDESSLAASITFRVYARNNPSLIAEAVTGLLTDRQTLIRTIDDALRLLPSQRRACVSTTMAVIEALDTDPLTVTLRAKLAVAALPWPESLAQIQRLAPSLHARALVAAAGLVRSVDENPDGNIEELERALATSEDERLRSMGFEALLGLAAGAAGWSRELRARLEAYRRDAAVLVREAAVGVFPPPLVEIEAGAVVTVT